MELLTHDERVTKDDVFGLSRFRAAVNDSFVPLHVSTARPEAFRGAIRGVQMDEVHITEVRATGHVVERTPELIARGTSPYYKISMMLEGTGMLVQDGREAILRPGDLAVYDTDRPYTLAFDDTFRTMVMMLPRHLVTLPGDVLGQLTAVRMSGSEGVGALVAPYLAQLAENLDQIVGATGARLVNSAVDLVTTVFTRELGMDVTGHPHRALLQRIYAHIDRNLGAADLGPVTIAAAHFISTRHLHALFHEQDTTISTWIRTRRLQQCQRALRDPASADRPVSAVAAQWGFPDAAHFSRVFKAAYGVSPMQFRASR